MFGREPYADVQKALEELKRQVTRRQLNSQDLFFEVSREREIAEALQKLQRLIGVALSDQSVVRKKKKPLLKLAEKIADILGKDKTSAPELKKLSL